MSRFAGSVDSTGISYNNDGSTAVQYALSASTTLGFDTSSSTIKIGSVSQNCGTGCNQPWQSRSYDSNGYPASYTDFNANVTKTVYGDDGLLAQKIEAFGTAAQRTTNFTWNSALRLPLSREVLDANGNIVSAEGWLYNSRGQVLALCEIDPTSSAAMNYSCTNAGTVPEGVRRWTYAYCDATDSAVCPLVGLLLSSTGPRTDVIQTTTYAYYLSSSAQNCGVPGGACYQAGDLHTVSDPSDM